MKTIKRALLTAQLALLSVLVLAQSVEEKIRQRVDYQETPGIAVGIYENGKTTYFAFGLANVQTREDITPNTLFEIGSITKVFTTEMAALLSVQKKIDFPDSAKTYLPKKIILPDKEAKYITIEHLATAHSGLPRMPGNFRPDDPENPYVDYNEDLLMEFINNYELSREPGSQYEYSNLGMGLLGYILTRVENKPYSKMVSALILEPLNMTNTFVSGERAGKVMATGYSGNQPVKPWTWASESVLTGAGGLVSNAEDMMKFLIQNLKATKESTPLAKAFALTHIPRKDAGTMKIGYGWHIRDEKIIWHNGGTGGFRSFAGFNPSTDKAVVILTNSNTGADDLGFHLLDESYTLKSLKKPSNVSTDQLRKHTGTYELMPGFNIVITLENGQLAAQATNQPKITIYPESENRFYYKVVNAQIEFIQNNGVTEKLILYQNNAELTGKKIN